MKPHGIALLCLALLGSPISGWAANSAASSAQALLALAQVGSKSDVLQAALESFKNLAINSVERPSMINPNAVPDKAVVVLAGNSLADKPAVKAFGRDVIYVTRQQVREQMLINFIKIDSIDLKSDTYAEVKLFYPYRAMGGTLKLTKTATGWQSNSSELTINPPGAQLFFAELFDGLPCRSNTEFARWNNAFRGDHSGQCPADPSAPKPDAAPASKTNKSAP